MAVEAASFRISIDSIELGLMLLMVEPSDKGKPSTTIKGLLPAVNVPIPRTLIWGALPGVPDDWIT